MTSRVLGSIAPYLTGASADAGTASTSDHAFEQVLGSLSADPLLASALPEATGLGLIELGRTLDALVHAKLVAIEGAGSDQKVSITDEGRALLALR